MTPEEPPERPDRGVLLTRLAGGLAHEIKNPLSTMSINLSLLEEEFTRGQSDQRAELSAREKRCMKRVATLQREIARLEDILEDFLIYARGGEINRSPQNLLEVLREVLGFVETEGGLQGIRQHVDLPSSLPLAIIDAGAMRQALLNLVVNARQAMPMGGELIVSAQREGSHVVLTITDTGVGMTPEDLERCFDTYWSTKKNGSGLGLATTRRIVHEHDGTISVVSELGRGTSFRVVLPLVVEITSSGGGSGS
ncbi:MAG: ATP-binding protein [bacterium]|nr:two-component sensor histidine kinase [Planctomycetota bacterium]HIL51638.1 two-component sensor histidine kinase [Planctomycetota bacterium]